MSYPSESLIPHPSEYTPQVVNESSTGSTTSKRVRLSLTIAVERVDFDSNSCLLRLSGRNSEENPHVKVRWGVTVGVRCPAVAAIV